MKAPAMILPPHEITDGSVTTPSVLRFLGDDRVPRPVRTKHDPFGEDHEPRVAEHSPYTDDACGTGRHLFDIVESVDYREVYDETGNEYLHDEQDFHARLTCIRCGKVVSWEGTRQSRVINRLNPVPITVGDLFAQHVSGQINDLGWDHSTWAIYRGGVPVGVISWRRGQRGRRFHEGRLGGWPGGLTVEGKSPLAVLRAVAKQDKQPAAVSA